MPALSFGCRFVSRAWTDRFVVFYMGSSKQLTSVFSCSASVLQEQFAEIGEHTELSCLRMLYRTQLIYCLIAHTTTTLARGRFLVLVEILDIRDAENLPTIFPDVIH